MSDHPPARSRGAYHRAAERGPWLKALRRLVMLGWSDRQIALGLSCLSAHNIELMTRHRLWSNLNVDGAMFEDTGPAWTQRQVRYYRREVLRLESRHVQTWNEAPERRLARTIKESRQAAARGWGHLAPLTRSELKILEELDWHGPWTLKQLEVRTGLNLDRDRVGRRTPLRRLLDRQIVAIVQLQPAPVYGLAEGIERRPVTVSLEEQVEVLVAMGKDHRGERYR